jgi:hypothetical protein
MRSFSLALVLTSTLAACSDTTGTGSGGGSNEGGGSTSTTGSAGDGGSVGDGGSPGAGGAPGTTTTSGDGGDGGGRECDAGALGIDVCEAVEACEPGSTDGCLAELTQERCASAACTDEYDAWLACVVELVEGAGWTECPDYPLECDAERNAYEGCAG